jgi:hypothetical protein
MVSPAIWNRWRVPRQRSGTGTPLKSDFDERIEILFVR